MKFVVFDLDNTLVDSLHLKPLRDARQWSQVYARIKTIEKFKGIDEVWLALRANKSHISIVTHSPRPYAEKVLRHVGLEPDELVAYHDLGGQRKPSPRGYVLGCKGRNPPDGVACGDERNDLLAADSFGCKGAFAGWSREPSLTKEECDKMKWAYLNNPQELLHL